MTTSVLPAQQLLMWPKWWYSQGLGWLLQKVGGFLVNQARGVNIVVWARNLFVPMFGERDNTSRLISFFVRFMMIIFKAVGLVLLLIPAALIIAGWMVLPVAVIYLLIRQVI